MEQATEKKTLQIRSNEETKAAFQKIAEDFPNAEAALSQLIETYEMAGKAALLPSYKGEIDSFCAGTKRLNDAFISICGALAQADENARANYANQLSSKDQTILEYQTKNKELTEQMNKYSHAADEAAKNLMTAYKEKDREVQARENAEKNLADKASINEMLTSKLNEAEAKAKDYDNLLKRYEKAESEKKELAQSMKDMDRDHHDKIKELQHQKERDIDNAVREAIIPLQQQIEQLKDQLRDALIESATKLQEASLKYSTDITSYQEKLLIAALKQARTNKTK